METGGPPREQNPVYLHHQFFNRFLRKVVSNWNYRYPGLLHPLNIGGRYLLERAGGEGFVVLARGQRQYPYHLVPQLLKPYSA